MICIYSLLALATFKNPVFFIQVLTFCSVMLYSFLNCASNEAFAYQSKSRFQLCTFFWCPFSAFWCLTHLAPVENSSSNKRTFIFYSLSDLVCLAFSHLTFLNIPTHLISSKPSSYMISQVLPWFLIHP